MKNSLIIITLVVFFGMAVLLGTVNFQFNQKYSQLEKKVSQLEVNIAEKTNQIALNSNIGDSNTFSGLVRSLDSIKVVIGKLQKEIEKFQKEAIVSTDSISSSKIAHLEHSVDSLKKLLSPKIPKIQNKRIAQAKERVVTHKDGMVLLTVDELCNAYNRNDAAAVYKYGKKPILLYGKINQIAHFVGPILYLKASKGYQTIACSFDDSETKSLLDYAVGDMITIKGVYTGTGSFQKCSLHE